MALSRNRLKRFIIIHLY